MNFQERIEKARQNQNRPEAANSNARDEGFDSDYFGIESARSHPACLDLRLADGSRKALPYSYIMEINFEPSEGIEIITSTKLIKITGRDMGKLYDYLAAYRVRYIQAHQGTDSRDEGLFVESIEIEES